MHPTPGASNVTTDTGGVDLRPLQVHPNPFSQQFYILAEDMEKPYRLMLVNVLGQVVYEAGNLFAERMIIGRGGLPAGLYSVVVRDAKGRRYLGKVAAE